ncbi:MAG: hypothetical protein CME32_16320 [Gimesia sp.]|nr:hypothetical protein [Gimesia sp.]
MPTYHSLIYRQRDNLDTPEFCLFHAPASEIMSWCDIQRLETGPEGAQRALNESRVRAVSRYLEDDLNTVPTAIIVALSLPEEDYPEGTGTRTAQLNIDMESEIKPGIVIDGQHRLLGIEHFDPTTHLNVVALLSDDPNEAAFQFFVINNKSSRVPTDHIKALLAERANERLRERIRKARLSISNSYEFVAIADEDDESPFQHLVDWPTNRTGDKWVKPLAIETAVLDIQDRKIREFKEEDFVIECFFLIWRAIKNKWPELWSENSRLLSKIGIVCMTQYITSLLVSAYDLGELDISNLDATQRRIEAALSYQTDLFWTVDWESASYDTHAGRKQVVQSLVQVSRNLRSGIDWKEDVLVIKGT